MDDDCKHILHQRFFLTFVKFLRNLLISINSYFFQKREIYIVKWGLCVYHTIIEIAINLVRFLNCAWKRLVLTGFVFVVLRVTFGGEMKNIENSATLEIKAQITNLNEWLDKSQRKSGLADLLFCPKELKAGKVADYIEEARNMLADYERGNFKDITGMIL